MGSEMCIRDSYKDGSIRDFAEANDHLSLQLLSKPVEKSFLCYPKELTPPTRS